MQPRFWSRSSRSCDPRRCVTALENLNRLGHSDAKELLLKDRSIYVSMNMRLCLGPAYGEDHRLGTLDWAPASAARSACIFCGRKAWQHGEGGSATRSYAACR